MPACVSARLPYALRRLLGKTRRTSSSSATLGLFYHPPLGQEDLRHDLEHISGPPAPDLELAFPADAGRLVPRDIGALQAVAGRPRRQQRLPADPRAEELLRQFVRRVLIEAQLVDQARP